MTDWPDIDEHEQRRRFARRPVQLPAKLHVGENEIDAVTENISPGGAFVNVTLPVATQEVVASIALPHGRDLHVRAKVRWRRHEPPGVGLEFETFLTAPYAGDLSSLR